MFPASYQGLANMMKSAILGLGLLALTACGAVADNRSMTERLPDIADYLNRNGNPKLTAEFPNATIGARVDEGDTLVIMVGNIPTGSTAIDPNALRKLWRPLVCGEEHYRQLFSEAGKVRMEITSNFGKKLPPVQYARC